jgi:hypothetical protein
VGNERERGERETLGAQGALSFFRQIGGSVGLTLAGTVFGATLQGALPGQMARHGVPSDVAAHFGGGAVDLNSVTAAGSDLGSAILAAALVGVALLAEIPLCQTSIRARREKVERPSPVTVPGGTSLALD